MATETFCIFDSTQNNIQKSDNIFADIANDTKLKKPLTEFPEVSKKIQLDIKDVELPEEDDSLDKNLESILTSFSNNVKEDDNASVLSKISQASNESMKMDYLLKLDDLKNNGHVVKDFTVKSKLFEIKKEVHRIEKSIHLKASIKFQQKILMFIVSALEYGNKKFDPLKMNLDGWSENVFENIDDFTHVFTKLYEKYKERGQMSPELELMLALFGSAFMFNMSKQLFQNIPSTVQKQELRDTIKRAFEENTTFPPERMKPEIQTRGNVNNAYERLNSFREAQLNTFKHESMNEKPLMDDDDRFSIASSTASSVFEPNTKKKVKKNCKEKKSELIL